MLDFSHAQHYLWEAGKLIDGATSAFVAPWVKERERLLLEDTVEPVSAHLQHFLAWCPALAPLLPSCPQHAARRRYGRDQQRGYFIGSGAIESAGKQLAATRIKGPGMRGKVTDLNALLALRCVFVERSWQS